MKSLTSEEFAAVEILNKAYTRKLTPDPTGGYVASIQEFPGCIAEGETADEALEQLERAAESWIISSLAHGRTIREPIDFNGYSGKVALRLPKTLHMQAAEYAEMEDVSINQFLVTAISNYIGQQMGCNFVLDKVKDMFSSPNHWYWPATYANSNWQNLSNHIGPQRRSGDHASLTSAGSSFNQPPLKTLSIVRPNDID